MLHLKYGPSWRANRDMALSLLARDVEEKRGGRILLVPEQASHAYERCLAARAGDCASRYAEVLSFTRLATRVFAQTGGGAAMTLDSGGRLLAMAAAVEQLRSQLKSYAAAGLRPEFLSGLVTAVDEFKSCCVSAQALRTASERTEGALAQKLEELSLLLEAYDGLCARFGQDPRDRMTRLLEQLELSDFARQHTLYIDGFSDFTRQELEIVAHFVEQSPQVTVMLTCDRVGSTEPGMELAGETAAALLRCSGGRYDLEYLADPEAETPLGMLRQHLLSGPVEMVPELPARAVTLANVRQECEFAAARIRQRVQGGARYRDMAVVLAEPERYGPVLRLVLDAYGIPAYFAGVEDILCKSVLYGVLTALEASAEELEQGWVLRYLKSVLSPLTPEECDALEHYAVIWGIRGSQWAMPLTRHPQGLGAEWTQEDRQALARLEEYRSRGLTPLLRLHPILQAENTTGEKLAGVYAFLEETDAPHRLEQLAQEMESRGDGRGAQEQEQLWDILMGAMEQMYALLGQTRRDGPSFLALFRLLLRQYDVGTIPQTLDCVTVGPLAAMRRQEAPVLFLLGAREDCLPKSGDGGLVLTEPERRKLMDLGIPLRADLYRQLEQELAGIAAVAGAATEFLYLTVSEGQSASVFRRLCRMLGQEENPGELPALDRTPDSWSAAARLCRGRREPGPFTAQHRAIAQQSAFRLGQLQPDTVRSLYGQRLQLSASQVDLAASCRFAYFMRYGLRAKVRKEQGVDPAEFGTFVHYVLEHTAKQVCREGGFQQVSLERTQALAEQFAQAYAQECWQDLNLSQRQSYLFARNQSELTAVVQELWEELSQALFQPMGFEVAFGRHGQMSAVDIPGGALPAELRGFVDRLDVYRRGEETFIRVVDYKTGKKDFDYCDILCGIGLQMLLYLFALESGGEAYLGVTPRAAGVLYFPARSPVLPTDGPVDPAQAESLRRKAARRKGLVLQDEDVMAAMDGGETPRFLPLRGGQGAKMAVETADRSQLEALRAYVMRTLKELVDAIASGQVEPNPYFRGSHDSCRFCDYAACCHLDLWGAPRIYRAVSSAEFWKEVCGPWQSN